MPNWNDLPAFLPQFPQSPDHVFLLAVLLVGAALTGRFLFRRLRLPQITGYAIVGLVAGAFGLDLLPGELAGEVRTIIDIALAVSLFELGARVDLGWMRVNRWLMLASMLEAFLTFCAVWAAMILVGFAAPIAVTVGIVAVSSSPAVVMRVASELKARGQVTERMLLLAALNSIYAVFAAKIVLGWLYGEYRGDWPTGVAHALYLICGSLVAAWALAKAVAMLGRGNDWRDENSLLLLIGLILLTLALTHALKLSVLLTPLLAGMLLRRQSPRLLLWPTHFGSAGGLLVVLLFVLTAFSLTPQLIMMGGIATAMVIAARLIAKTIGAVTFGAASGLSFKQSICLGVALSPMSGLAFVLTSDLLDSFPQLADSTGSTLMGAIAVMQILGPLLVRWALVRSGEAKI